MPKKTTQKEYIKFLDENAPDFGSDEWIIGGKVRPLHMATRCYGAALRTYDPIGFNVGFKEYKRKFNTRM